MKKVAIIGANSAIAKNFIDHFFNDFELYLVSRSIIDTSLRESIQILQTNYDDLEELSDFLKNVDVIIYCIGITNGPISQIENINITLFKSIMNSLSHEVPVIFISSIAVEMNDDTYARTKRQSEEYLKEINLKHIILRPTVLYGKYDRNNLFKIKNIVRKFPLLPFFGKQVTVQPLGLFDLSLVLKSIIDMNIFNGKSYSLSGNEQIPIDQIISSIQKYYSLKRLKIYIPIRLIQACLSIINPILPKDLGLLKQIKSMKPHPPISNKEAALDLGFKPSIFRIEDID